MRLPISNGLTSRPACWNAPVCSDGAGSCSWIGPASHPSPRGAALRCNSKHPRSFITSLHFRFICRSTSLEDQDGLPRIRTVPWYQGESAEYVSERPLPVPSDGWTKSPPYWRHAALACDCSDSLQPIHVDDRDTNTYILACPCPFPAQPSAMRWRPAGSNASERALMFSAGTRSRWRLSKDTLYVTVHAAGSLLSYVCLGLRARDQSMDQR